MVKNQSVYCRILPFKSYLYLGNEYANAGDGMTFTLTNDPRMSTTPQEVIGSPGMGIGAYPRKLVNLMLEMPYRLSLIPIKILVVPTEWTEKFHKIREMDI